MGFNSVYRGLQDVFPQVDTRILRAVAIENSKDVDRAVEVVLMEVLPCMSKGTTSDLSNDSQENAHLADCVEDTLQSDSKFLNETAYVGPLNGSSYYDANGGGDQVCGSDGKEIIAPMDSITVQAGFNQGSSVLSAISKDDVPSNLDCLVESNLEQLCLNVSPSEEGNSVVQLAPLSIHECILDTPRLGLQNSDHGESEESGSSDAASDKCISDSEMVDFKDESALNTEVTRSGQICRIDLLEDIVEAARNNKKTLFSAMESVISLMRDVELQERAAEQVKEEAVRGGLDILTRVEDLKQMLRHAREANDMHAGEVYGEKAILATEAKELQSRLLSLSDERDKSLAILVEMRQTLEERLDAAEKQRKAAEEEKMEKEELARNALAEQELIMEKVVQESKMLKQEAEENSKLREFLMDRGRVVDILQGEISVICQDVKLLKEKFDERVPLSESLSSSQTSCRLASSSSSLKSLIPDPVPEQTETTFDTPKKTSPTPSVTDQLSSREEREANDRVALLDDEWELFDNNDLNL